MQEELKTKLKRTAKKVAAIGAGALVAGATMASAALAADLTGLPAPIVSSGAFDAYVVVGTSATTVTAETLKDVAGAIEVSTAFGQLATTSTGSEGSATLQVEQFAGETLTAFYIDPTVADVYHEDQSGNWDWITASGSDLTMLDDVVFLDANDAPYNATISIDLEPDYVVLNRQTLGVTINASTATKKNFRINISTNRTGAYTFALNDKINWFGTLYEIVDVLSDGNITIGTTSSVKADELDTFTIGGASFVLNDVVTETSVYVTPVGGEEPIEINKTQYTTVGGVKLKLKKAVPGTNLRFAEFQTVETGDSFGEGDAWPFDTNFVVDTMTTDPDVNVINSSILLRNNVSYTLGAKGSEAEIVEGLSLRYNDNTEDQTAANSLVHYGGSGQINISELSGVTNYIYGNATAEGVGQAEFQATTFSLPGAKIYNFTADDFPDELTSLSNNTTGWDGSDRIYLFDVASGRYEAAFKPLSSGNLSYYIPKTQTTPAYNYTTLPLTGSEWDYQVSGNSQLWVNHTTPSGVKISMIEGAWSGGFGAYIQLQVAAIKVTVDSDATADTFYGRKGVSWTSAKYSDYGAKITWTSTGTDTGDVAVTEPNGQTVTVGVKFQSDNDAIFEKRDYIKLGASEISVTGYGNATAGVHDTTFGSSIGLLCSVSNANCQMLSTTDSIEESSPIVDDIVAISTPRKDISLGIGSIQPQNIELDTDPATTTSNTGTVGNTTITLVSGSGSSVTVNKITPGVAKLDSEITTGTLSKPVVLLGGSAINSLVKQLVDAEMIDYTDLAAQGTGHAQIDFVEEAFNEQTALVIAGYSGSDTLMAARAVAGALLNTQPFDFADYNVTSLLLNTGTTAVNDVSVMS